MLLRTDLMREVTVNVAARSVRVGAGVLWGEVTAALAPHGLTALAGSSADVGVVGYTLGGGYSWLSIDQWLRCWHRLRHERGERTHSHSHCTNPE